MKIFFAFVCTLFSLTLCAQVDITISGRHFDIKGKPGFAAEAKDWDGIKKTGFTNYSYAQDEGDSLVIYKVTKDSTGKVFCIVRNPVSWKDIDKTKTKVVMMDFNMQEPSVSYDVSIRTLKGKDCYYTTYYNDGSMPFTELCYVPVVQFATQEAADLYLQQVILARE